MGPGCTDETLLSAIASALHTSTLPITGQLSAAVEKNPGVWLNTAQPLCKAFMVTDDDIRYLAPHAHPHPQSVMAGMRGRPATAWLLSVFWNGGGNTHCEVQSAQ